MHNPMSEKAVVEIADSDFETQVLQVDGPVLVYFWAPWCGPCRLVSPSVNWAAETYSDRLKVVKMEVDPSPNAVKHCQVEGVPALILFNQGEIVESVEGAITKPRLQSLLNDNL